MKAIYDEIGIDYSVMRRTDPKIAEQLHTELEGATRIVNIGAGTGSYEPADIDLVAVEPSAEMISQRKKDSHPVKQAFAEKLPFEDKTFSHAMTILSMHHWKDRKSAFKEINRVTTEKFVAITWDLKAEPFWLTRDYFPEIYDEDISIFPSLDELNEHFDNVQMKPLLIPEDCIDGFLAAFWKRPKAYLSSQVRQSISSFSKIEKLDEGLQKLKNDLKSGLWEKNNREILESSNLDVGYKLITANLTNK